MSCINSRLQNIFSQADMEMRYSPFWVLGGGGGGLILVVG